MALGRGYERCERRDFDRWTMSLVFRRVIDGRCSRALVRGPARRLLVTTKLASVKVRQLPARSLCVAARAKKHAPPSSCLHHHFLPAKSYKVTRRSLRYTKRLVSIGSLHAFTRRLFRPSARERFSRLNIWTSSGRRNKLHRLSRTSTTKDHVGNGK
jgi:hypothetical protein